MYKYRTVEVYLIEVHISYIRTSHRQKCGRNIRITPSGLYYISTQSIHKFLLCPEDPVKERMTFSRLYTAL
jgi:hypothetical protein